MPNYTHTTFGQAKTAVLNRLGDSTFWSAAEVGLYLKEALRAWASHSLFWRERYVYSLTQNVHWYDLATLSDQSANTPLANTVNDQDLLEEIQYHLLETVSRTSWAGTIQFTLADVEGAIQRRRDQFLSELGLNLVRSLESMPINGLFDYSAITPHIIDIRRIAFLAQANSSFTHLWRTDEDQERFYDPTWNLSPGTPERYSVGATSPLSLQLMPPPNAPGQLEIVSQRAGASINVAIGVVLGVPDNLAWIVKWGVLADLLAREGPSTDIPRARYCERRWQQGIQLAKDYPLVVQAEINGVPKTITNVQQLDSFEDGWQNLAAATPEQIAFMGFNLFAVSPKPNAGPHSVTFDVVRPAPIPATDATNIQVGRSELDVILDYAHHIASFKQGGLEFLDTEPQLGNFIAAAAAHNRKLAARIKEEEAFHGRGREESKDRPNQSEQ